MSVNESVVEKACLAWIERLDCQVAHGPDIGADTPAAGRLYATHESFARRVNAVTFYSEPLKTRYVGPITEDLIP